MKNIFDSLEFTGVNKDVVEKAKRIVNTLGANPLIEYADNDKIVLVFTRTGPERLVLTVDKWDRICFRISIPGDNGILIACSEEELPELYQQFLRDKLKTWKEYRLRHFKAIQWAEDNFEEVTRMMSGDPDTGYETEIKEGCCGDTFTILHVFTNNYCENCCHEITLYPYDYLVSWGDHYKKFNHRFFEEFFEEV